MKLLVCGGRHFSDRRVLNRTLTELHEVERVHLVITGGAAGADALAGLWAAEKHIPLCIFPAHWGRMGKSAGPERNAWMLEFGKPDVVLAFPGGRGTENMMSLARREGVRLIDHCSAALAR